MASEEKKASLEAAGTDIATWIERTDARTGRTYWGNLKTKKTTWEEPETVRRWRSSSVEESFEEFLDTKTSLPYYVCKRTQTSTWIKPLGKINSADVLTKVKQQSGTDTPKERMKDTKKSSLLRGAAADQKKSEANTNSVDSPVSEHSTREDITWVECLDSKRQRAYYFNAQTGKSTWTKPACGQIIKATLWQQLKAKGRAIRQKTQQGVVTLTKSKETVQKETTDHTNNDTTETKDALSEAVAAPSLDGAKSDVEAGETDERNIETKTASDIADATEAPRDALPLHGDHADACEKEILEDDPSATVCEDGSIEGWLWVQAQTQKALKMYSCLRNGALICTETKPSDSTKSDEMALQFDMKVATDVCVYDSEDVADNTDKESGALECTFCISLEGVAQTWILGTSSIEDFQTWLDALQQQVRRTRVSSIENVEDVRAHRTGSSPSRALREANSLLHSRRQQSMRRVHTNLPGSAQSSPRILSHILAADPRHYGAVSARGDNDAPGVQTAHASVSWTFGPGHENFVAWASSHGFDANVDKFASAGYDDLELLAGLNDDDLKEMLAHHVEIAKPGHRMKVVLAVRKLRSLIKST